MPDTDPLIAHQRRSFDAFTQADVAPDARLLQGLEACLREHFPIRSFCERHGLALVRYAFDEPEGDPHDCLLAGTTWQRALRVTLLGVRLEVAPDGARQIVDAAEEEVVLGAIPWMTDAGTFIIDGVERVVHPQLAREPGVWFTTEDVFAHGFARGDGARIEPLRGPRVEVRVAKKTRTLEARLGPRARWVPATTLARAMGLSREELLTRAYAVETLRVGTRDVALRFDPARLAGRRAARDVVVNGEVRVARHRKFTRAAVKALVAAGVTELAYDDHEVEGTVAARDVVDEDTGEVIVEVGEPVTRRHLARVRAAGVREVPLLIVAQQPFGPVYDRTLRDLSEVILRTEMGRRDDGDEEARLALWQSVHGPEYADPRITEAFVQRTFGDVTRFDLSPAGRARMNRLLGTLGDARTLTADDVVATLVALVRRVDGFARDPDEPRLGDGVVRGVGELLEGAVRDGLARVSSITQERLSLIDLGAALWPRSSLDARPLERAVKDLFTRTRVSAPVARVNPVAAVAQSRWLGAVEPASSSSKRSGFALEDTAWTQYKLLCPIEARDDHGPPGSALALGARVGWQGRLEATFLLVGAQGELHARSVDALTLDGAPLRVDDGEADAPFVPVITATGAKTLSREQVAWRDPSRDEWVGVAAALVPFAVHDAPERWSAGARNLREALPPLRATTPRVASALDARVAATANIAARAAGEVVKVSAREVVVRGDGDEVTHPLRSFEPARGGVIRERPCVAEGDRVAAGDALAQAHGVVDGTLACGDDVLVALMPWAGFNDHGAVAVSERLVREGRLCTAQVRVVTGSLGRAVGGRHELTRDAADLDAGDRARLDDEGLARVGARVREGDALAGRSLVRKDAAEGASLRAPRGCEGVVTRAEVYRPDRRAEGTTVVRVWVVERRPLSVGDLVGSRHGERSAVARIVAEEDLPLLDDGRAVEAVVNPAAVFEDGDAVGILCEMMASGGASPIELPRVVSCCERHPGGGEAVRLRDGRTGELFLAPVSVGALHLLKLTPLVDDVFEARARGPRDDTTREPVGDAAHAPGQPFDEDAVSALMAWGAAETLRETLGARGDDPHAADALDAALARGEAHAVATGAQAFARFMKTLQAAGLDVVSPRRTRR